MTTILHRRSLLLLAMTGIFICTGVPDAGAREKAEPGPTLQRLHAAAGAWLARDLKGDQLRNNRAYADLIFAFAFARIKDADQSRKLLDRATAALKNGDEVHRCLLKAYTFRIEAALAGRPHSGPLPEAIFEQLPGRMAVYTVDRQRDFSRILEPTERIDPYRYWGGRVSAEMRKVAELYDIRDPKELEKRIRQLLADVGTEQDKIEPRLRVLGPVLSVASRAGVGLVAELLKEVPPLLVRAGTGDDLAGLLQRAFVLELALPLASDQGDRELARALLARVPVLVAFEKGPRDGNASLIAASVACIRKLDLRPEGADLYKKLAARLWGDKELADLRKQHGRQWAEALCALVHLESLRLSMGQTEKAQATFEEVRTVLFAAEEKEGLTSPERTRLARAYATALSVGPAGEARTRLEELLKRLPPVTETYTTTSHYFRYRLMILESVVFSVVQAGR